MGLAARITDKTSHDGVILGPGAPTVLIEGLPASVLGDGHNCSLPDSDDHPGQSDFFIGSSTVLINGKPALRAGDEAVCGAKILPSQASVFIG